MRFVIEHLSKSFEKKTVLKDINLRLRAERSMAFWGATGQGKPRFSIVSIEI